MKFEVLERVRWNDCDATGIIYYGAYVRNPDGNKLHS